MKPYYEDSSVTLYCGKMEDLLPDLGSLHGRFDACITDPPYGETSLSWDRWPPNWPSLVSRYTNRLWCFGTLGMFMDHAGEFSDWRRPRSIVWEKHNGTGFATDFFKVVHELGGYFYRGPWSEAHEEAPREEHYGADKSGARRTRTPHTGDIGLSSYVDDGRRMIRSVIKAPSVRGGFHNTEKPAKVLAPLIEYACPKGGVVLDPFAGSSSTLLTARTMGRRAVGIERSEQYCEKAAERLSIPDLFGGAA